MPAALVAAALPFLPAAAHAAPAPPQPLTSADLPRLTAELTAITTQAQQLSDQLDAAAARDGGLRAAYSRLDDAKYDAQQALDARARAVYMAASSAALSNEWQAAFADPTGQVLLRRASSAELTVDQSLIDDVTTQSAQVAALQKQADAFRRTLMVQAQGVLAAEDQAYTLYAQAKALADAEHDAAAQAALEAQRLALGSVASTVSFALTPAQTARARNALTQQGPIVDLLERTGAGIPEGYALTGNVVSGQASWYGPGFEGRPTASGAPYDSERLTCANKELPLGTVIHVTANGYAINCLVNDRGPYVNGRILDMSRAGSRALGYSGLAQVTIQVLTPL